MGKKLIYECDGCPMIYEGNVATGYSPGGWLEFPLIGGVLNLCPGCSRAVMSFVSKMKRESASPQLGNEK